MLLQVPTGTHINFDLSRGIAAPVSLSDEVGFKRCLLESLHDPLVIVAPFIIRHLVVNGVVLFFQPLLAVHEDSINPRRALLW